MGDGEAPHRLGDRLRFGAVGLQELQARRGGGEEIGDLDAGAGRRRRGTHRSLGSELHDDRGTAGRISRPRHDGEARHGADGGQRLAAEAEGADGEEIAVRQLGGGVALDGQLQIRRRHAGAVVDDTDAAPAAGLDGHLDGAGAGVDGVLDQFFHGRGRPLDHFARRDAVDEDGIEAADGHGHTHSLPLAGRGWGWGSTA
jgi:hypothetical protein